MVPPPPPPGASATPPDQAPEHSSGTTWGVVVPAGGRGSRLGGADKPALVLDGRTLLEHLLDGLPPGVPVALVGPERQLALAVGRPLLRCREDPPGGGPAAALAAGARALAAAAEGAPAVVVVLPGDAPLAAGAVPALLRALERTPGARAAVAVDGGGRRQVLVAAHRSDALAERIDGLESEGGAAGTSGTAGLAGLPAARLLPPGDALVEVPVDDALLADVDAPGDLERLQRSAPADRLRRAEGPGPA